MTEAEWLAATDPDPMLEHVRREASDRKLRLFACACGYDVWKDLLHECSREAIAVAERYADGLAEHPELLAAFRRADRAGKTVGERACGRRRKSIRLEAGLAEHPHRTGLRDSRTQKERTRRQSLPCFFSRHSKW